MIESIRAVTRALNEAGVEYLVVGGVAVALHGYLRPTEDIDLVIRLDQQNVVAALEALASLGYRPTIPVNPRDFADPEIRRRWIDEKGLTVFSLTSDRHRRLVVDVFASEPFDFGREAGLAVTGDLGEGAFIPLVSVETLVRMKESVGRANDRDDVEQLRRILSLDNGQPRTSQGRG